MNKNKKNINKKKWFIAIGVSTLLLVPTTVGLQLYQRAADTTLQEMKLSKNTIKQDIYNNAYFSGNRKYIKYNNMFLITRMN